MEVDVSKKVREAIKAKLVELGCFVDDELPNYIMILIANRRSSPEMESDLALFLGSSTKVFVTWLSMVLKKLEEVTASGGSTASKVAAVKKEETATSSVVTQPDASKSNCDSTSAEPKEPAKVEQETKAITEKNEFDKNSESKSSRRKSESGEKSVLAENTETTTKRRRSSESKRHLESSDKISSQKSNTEKSEKVRERSRERKSHTEEENVTSRSRFDNLDKHLSRSRLSSRIVSKALLSKSESFNSKKEYSIRESPAVTSTDGISASLCKSSRDRDEPERSRRQDSSSRVKSTVSRRSLESKVEVTKRPKRDVPVSGKILLRAVQDAQKSIIRKEQEHSTSPTEPESRKRRKESDDESTIKRRAFDNRKGGSRYRSKSPDSVTKPVRDADKSLQRRSVKERLGAISISVPSRPSIKDRLGYNTGLITSKYKYANQTDHEYSREEMDFEYGKVDSPENFNLVINVVDDNRTRNVSLAGHSDREVNESKRILIQSSADTDTESEDEKSSSESPVKRTQTMEVDDDEGVTPASMEDPKYDPEEHEIIIQEVVSDQEFNSVESMDDVPRKEEQKIGQAQKSDITYENVKGTLHQPIKPIVFSNNSNESTNQNFQTPVSSASSRTTLPSVLTTASPNIKCKYWPNCQFKDECIYEHPKCKFTPCKNKDCMYKHDIQSKKETKKLCKFYPKCTSMNCKFLHPKPCRFGVGCTDGRCENYHPGVTLGVQKLNAKGVLVIPKINQLKWVKSTT